MAVVFDKTGISDCLSRKAFKILVQPFTRYEHQAIAAWLKESKEETRKYMFLVKHLNIDLKIEENDTTNQIKKNHSSFNFLQFYYPKNRSGMYTNMVIFLVNCSAKNASDLAAELRMYPQQGSNFVNVKFDLYDPSKY